MYVYIYTYLIARFKAIVQSDKTSFHSSKIIAEYIEYMSQAINDKFQ